MYQPDPNDPRILRTLISIETPVGSIDLRACPPSAEGRTALLWLVDALASDPLALAELRYLATAEPRLYGWVLAMVEVMLAVVTDPQPAALYLAQSETEPLALALLHPSPF
jgi:hypothetical protein